MRWETDLYVFSHLSMDTLDYTGPEVNKGSKGVILGLGEAVRDLPGEWRGELPSGVSEVRVFCPGCLVVTGPSYQEEKAAPQRLASHAGFGDWPLIVMSDDAAFAAASSINFLWTTFTRFEPAADIYSRSTRLVRGHPSREGPVVIDARIKPWYPDEVAADPDVAKRVEMRWSEYFPDGKVEMGAGERGHLT